MQVLEVGDASNLASATCYCAGAPGAPVVSLTLDVMDLRTIDFLGPSVQDKIDSAQSCGLRRWHLDNRVWSSSAAG
jgi:hypothetical protein